MGVITKQVSIFKKRKKCYVVTLSPADGWLHEHIEILGVFSTEEKAERFADEMAKMRCMVKVVITPNLYVNDYGQTAYITIEEREMDKEPGEICYSKVDFHYKQIKLED